MFHVNLRGRNFSIPTGIQKSHARLTKCIFRCISCSSARVNGSSLVVRRSRALSETSRIFHKAFFLTHHSEVQQLNQQIIPYGVKETPEVQIQV